MSRIVALAAGPHWKYGLDERNLGLAAWQARYFCVFFSILVYLPSLRTCIL
jgi:hypothetical protein